MVTLRELLFGLAAPAVASVIVMLLAWRFGRSSGTSSAMLKGYPSGVSGFVAPFSLCLGFLIGITALRGIPSLPPAQAAQSLYWATGAMAILVSANFFVVRARWLWHTATIVIFVLTIHTIVLRAAHGWSQLQIIGWVVGCACAAAIVLFGLQRLPGNNDLGLTAAIPLAVLSVVSSTVLGMSGSQVYALDTAALCAAFAPIVLLAAPLKVQAFPVAAAPIFLLIFGGMLLCGYLYAELTAINALLLFFAPLTLLLDQIPYVKHLRSWQRCMILLFAILVPAGVALGLSLHKFLVDMADFSAY